MLGDDNLSRALVEVVDDCIAVECLIGNQAFELNAFDQRLKPVERCPGKSSNRTRLPSASVKARILVVIPPFDRPMAWL